MDHLPADRTSMQASATRATRTSTPLNGRLLEAIQKAAAAVQKPNPYPTWKPVPEEFTPREVFGAERLPEPTLNGEAVDASELDSLPKLDEVCAPVSAMTIKCANRNAVVNLKSVHWVRTVKYPI